MLAPSPRVGASRWRALAAIASVTACVMALAACGGTSTNTSGSAGASPKTVKNITIGLPVVDATFIPVWLAQDRGFYKAEGLNAQIVTFQGGADLTKAVAAGSVDVGVNGLGGIMPAIIQGQPLKVVYGGFNEVSYQWMAAPGVKSVQDAKGKAWGVTKIGSDTDFMTRYVLNKNGIAPANGAKIVQGISSPAAADAALSTGQIQVAAVAADNDQPLKEKSKGYHLIASESDYTKSYPDHMVFGQQSYIQQNQSTVTSFLRALSKAITFEKSNPSAAQQAMIKYEKVNPQYAKASYDTFVNSQFADGRLPDAAGMDFFWQVGLQNGEFKSKVADSKWLDNHWISTYSTWSKSS